MLLPLYNINGVKDNLLRINIQHNLIENTNYLLTFWW